MKESRTKTQAQRAAPGFHWDVYENYTWDRGSHNESDIFPTGKRLRTFRLDDSANQEQLLEEFSSVTDEQGALNFSRTWGLIVPYPKMKVVLAAAASVRWLLCIVAALETSDYGRIRQWIQTEDEDVAFGDLIDWLETAPGREWMRKARCKHFPPYFDKLVERIRLSPRKPLTTIQKTVWSKYQRFKRQRADLETFRAFLQPTQKDRRDLKCWSGLITNANIDQTSDKIEVYMYLSKSHEIDDPKVLAYFARHYLSSTANEMMKEHGPSLLWCGTSLDSPLAPALRIDTPWAAVCMALFIKVAGIGRLSLCPHPQCGRLFSGREHKEHCGEPRCAKWVYRHPTLSSA